VRVLLKKFYWPILSKNQENSKARHFLMLTSTIQLKKNIEINKYASLITFIKRKSTGQVTKKSDISTKQEIEMFLKEADNGTYLMRKVNVTFP
jgi:hypothetical protein